MENLPLRIPDAAPPARVRAVPLEPWLPEEDGPELREYARILAKRRWLVAGFALAVVAVVGAFTLLETPLYTAETMLMIEPTDPRVIDIPHVLGESFGYESAYYTTQHEILRNRSLVSQVIHEEELAGETAFFDGGSHPVAELAGLVQLPVHWITSWLAPREAGAGDDSDEWLVDLYLGRLGVQPIPDSRLVRLYFSSVDPVLAARVVNAHAKAYIAQGLALRTRANDEARRFLEDRLGELRNRLERSEGALNAYRREHGIVSLEDKGNVVIDRLADLNERLTAAQTDRIRAETDYRQVRERAAESLPAVLESPIVKALKEEIARLEGERAFLASRFKAGYPRLAQLEAQIAEGRRRLGGEVRSIVAGIESAYLAARAREDELRARMEEQKAEALRLEDASVEYAILAQEAETTRQLYDVVRQRIQETSVAAEIQASNVFVIDEALPPTVASSPRTGRNLAFGALLGLLGGIGLAFLAEYLDNRLKGPQDVERYLRLPSLGLVPDFARVDTGWSRQLIAGGWSRSLVLPGASRVEVVPADEPPEPATEAYRAIRTSILLSQAGEPPRTILFTSSTDSEGKTTTVLHTALMFARLGTPVLVIDADLRRPSCHDVLGVPNGPGLTEVLAGHEGKLRRLELQKTQLSFLGAGSVPPNPTELLGSQRMREVLARLRERFSYVLIDAPPLAPVSDSVVLSTLVDGVVLVVDQQHTPRQTVHIARARLAYARAKVLGVVLNRCDPAASVYADFAPEFAS